MLTVCLHQLVLRAERKQPHADSRTRQGAAASCCTATGSISSGGSSSSSSCCGGKRTAHAELAVAYLLQHPDTLQAKLAAAPSRAAVAAWRAVYECQWATASLPLLPQAAAVVLASIHPSAAATASVSKVAVAAVWALQDCGPLSGCFGPKGCIDGLPTAAVGRPGVSGRSGSRAASPSTNSRCWMDCDSPWSAFSLPTALMSDPTLTTASCTFIHTALSALCRHLAGNSATPASSRCNLACTLLATAAAAISLQGAAAALLVHAAVAAATAMVSDQPAAQQHGMPDVPFSANLHNIAAVEGKEPGSISQPRTEATTASAAAGSGAASVPVPNQWLLCLSLAANFNHSGIAA